MKAYVLIITGDRELSVVGTYKSREEADKKMFEEFMDIFNSSSYYNGYDDFDLNDENEDYGYIKGYNAYVNEVHHVDYDLYIEEIEI